MAQQIDRYLLAIAADVAKALEGIDTGEAPFGNYYVARVTFGFDGDDVPKFAVIPDEHGTYAVEVTE